MYFHSNIDLSKLDSLQYVKCHEAERYAIAY